MQKITDSTNIHSLIVLIVLFVVSIVTLVFSGCAKQPLRTTSVILLPQANGAPSAVLISATSHPNQLLTVLQKPYQRATHNHGGDTIFDQTNSATIQAKYPKLFTSMPPQAVHFRLNFVMGGLVLTPESQNQLNQILQDTKNHVEKEIVVTGHTDSVGTDSNNDTLSLKRAQQVAQWLVGKGVSSKQIDVVGRGKRQLLVLTANDVDEPKNRRVDIVVR